MRTLILIVAALAMLAVTPTAAANDCTVSFTQIPDFIIPAPKGTCNGGTCVVGEVGGLTDVLEITVGPLPACEDCKVEVKATWAGGSQMKVKGRDAMNPADKYWPHKI